MGSFKDVVGHKDIIKYIQSSVENGQVGHAYILNGERGSGKKKGGRSLVMCAIPADRQRAATIRTSSG